MNRILRAIASWFERAEYDLGDLTSVRGLAALERHERETRRLCG